MVTAIPELFMIVSVPHCTLQWGNQAADELSYTFSFNIAFTQCYRVYAVDNTGTSGSAFVAAILDFDANTCTVTTDKTNSALRAFSWFAIGR